MKPSPSTPSRRISRKSLTAAIDRERLANMRATEWEEAAQSAQRALAEQIALAHKLAVDALRGPQSATATLPPWVLDWTPEMMQAVEDYYANWQRIGGKKDADKVKADAWSAFHAWRAAVRAAADNRVEQEEKG